MSDRMKVEADDENEIRDVASFEDGVCNRVTPVVQFPAEIALAVVDALAGIVRKAHASEIATTADRDGIVRAQSFEEGEVYMLESPFDEYFADGLLRRRRSRYLFPDASPHRSAIRSDDDWTEDCHQGFQSVSVRHNPYRGNHPVRAGSFRGHPAGHA
jgi:hypothetical protein